MSSPPDVAPRGRVRSDTYAVAVYIGLAFLIFGLPAALGHPVLPGDDRTQNFPLRVLVGADLRAGHLPLFDPYIWSGAPLLSGWNAGAAYPFTWLFAIFPAGAAWPINQVIATATAATGTFVFLRASRLSTLSAFLGGFSFAFAGAMASQTPHFGLLAGMSWLPWMLLALLQLTRNPTFRHQLTWATVFAGAGAACVLAGEPRAVDAAVVIVGAYAAWRALHMGRGALHYSAIVVLGIFLSAAFSAIQWAPGLDAISTSQRAAHTMVLYSSGSLPLHWLLLLFVPNLLGGASSFNSPGFLASYNISEVTGYVGILPLVAAFALPFAPRRLLHRSDLVSSPVPVLVTPDGDADAGAPPAAEPVVQTVGGWRMTTSPAPTPSIYAPTAAETAASTTWSPYGTVASAIAATTPATVGPSGTVFGTISRGLRRPTDHGGGTSSSLYGRFRRLPDWTVWHLVAILGIIMALGGNTPFGDILFHLPLFGAQRLQSRNIMVTDFALAVLLAYWVDSWVQPRLQPAAEAHLLRAARRWRKSEVIPAALAGCTVLVAIAWGAGLEHWLGAQTKFLDDTGQLIPWLLPSLFLSLAVTFMLIAGRRWKPSTRATAVTVFVVADIIAFTVTSVVALGYTPPHAATTLATTTTTTPSSTTVPPSTPTTLATGTTGGLGTLNTTPATPATSDPVDVPPATAMGARYDHFAYVNTVPIASFHVAGRFAVYDPDLRHTLTLTKLGVTDVNVFTHSYSVQGYGSIVDGHYAAITGTHAATGTGQDALSPAAIRSGTLAKLDTSLLFTPASYLLEPLGTPPPKTNPTSGQRTPRLDGQAEWSFGQRLNVSSITISCSLETSKTTPANPGGLKFWMREYAGAKVPLDNGQTVPCTTPITLTLPGGMNGIGLVVRATGRHVHLGPPTMTDHAGLRLIANGNLQTSLIRGGWLFIGHDGPYGIWDDPRAKTPVRLRPLPGKNQSSIAGATIRILVGPGVEPASVAVQSPNGAAVVRATASIPGWSATWQATGSSALLHLAVHKTGVAQKVTVPPGAGTLTWNYTPPGWGTGEILLWGSLIGLLAAGSAWGGVRLARRRSRQHPSVLVAVSEGALHPYANSYSPFGTSPIQPAPQPHTQTVPTYQPQPPPQPVAPPQPTYQPVPAPHVVHPPPIIPQPVPQQIPAHPHHPPPTENPYGTPPA